MTDSDIPLTKLAVMPAVSLIECFGERIFTRGRNYQRQDKVMDLAITHDNGLLAWVMGSERYATHVKIYDNNEIESICTCPYSLDCKHAVAVILEYQKRFSERNLVPFAEEDDTRLKLLDEELSGEEEYADDDWEEDEEDTDCEDDESVDMKLLISSLGKKLETLTSEQLVELIMKLATRYPMLREDLVYMLHNSKDETKILVERLRADIESTSKEPGWYNYWSGDRYTPDYSKIRERLQLLLEKDETGEVLDLGMELIISANRLLDECDDEGETAAEITLCIPLIVEALRRSPLSPVEKLRWAVDAVLEDDHGICDEIEDYLHENHPCAAWSTLADILLEQLDETREKDEFPSFSRAYHRDQKSNWAIHALEQADRTGEVIPLCEKEAEVTNSYDRLVSRLMTAQRFPEAEEWIQRGMRNAKRKQPNVVYKLRIRLREIRVRQEDWMTVAAIDADSFVQTPCSTTFKDCAKSAGRAKVWDIVRNHLMNYLEKGVPPWEQNDWPLPETGLPREKNVIPFRLFPMVNILIDIAIEEKKPDQVLYWYDQTQDNDKHPFDSYEDKIADAIKDYAPNRAVAIWQTMAEDLIDQVKPKAYVKAAHYLLKAGKLMSRLKRNPEFRVYLAQLRQKHARKRKLIEVLAGLENI